FIVVCLPFVCAALGAQCWNLWTENRRLVADMERFETESQAAAARADRLEKFEKILDEDTVEGREAVLRKLAHNDAPPPDENQAPSAMEEGPGHQDFPAIDTGRVKVSNVQARITPGNRVRLALDLRNPDNEKLLSGEILATLVTARGEEYPLVFAPAEMANFRINRFKRSVLAAKVPNRFNLANSEIIIEVKESGGETIYRNLFATHE
ncbi:MAG: hypothetical protein K2H64_06095, partial [Desulfovibrio sp.]|nr:hypothetical protein [Desulfovibrio sp.]